MIHRTVVLARHEFRLFVQNVEALVMLIVFPIVAISFLKPLLGPTLRSQGAEWANGSETTVPGMALMFGFVLVGFAVIGMFREHDWHTWDRLRTKAGPAEMVLGKLAPLFALLLVQFLALYTAGVMLFDLRVQGSHLALGAVGLALALCFAALAMAIAAVSQSIQQVAAFTNIGAMVVGGLGGAVTPVALMPTWVQGVAHLTPGFWAMSAARRVVVGGAGLADVALSVAILVAFTTVFATVAIVRFRVDHPKRWR